MVVLQSLKVERYRYSKSDGATLNNCFFCLVFMNSRGSRIIDHPLLFYHGVAYEICKRPALVTSTFSNSRDGRLRELRLY